MPHRKKTFSADRELGWGGGDREPIAPFVFTAIFPWCIPKISIDKRSMRYMEIAWQLQFCSLLIRIIWREGGGWCKEIYCFLYAYLLYSIYCTLTYEVTKDIKNLIATWNQKNLEFGNSQLFWWALKKNKLAFPIHVGVFCAVDSCIALWWVNPLSLSFWQFPTILW